MEQEIKKEVLKIIDTFGMKLEVVAKAMNVGAQTVSNKLLDSNTRHKFNKKNYNDLVTYIKDQAENLKHL